MLATAEAAPADDGAQQYGDHREGTPDLFGRFLAGYARVLDGVLQRRWIGLVVAFVLVAGGIVGATRVGMEFMPVSDMGEFTVDVEMPAGTSLRETDRIVGRLEQ